MHLVPLKGIRCESLSQFHATFSQCIDVSGSALDWHVEKSNHTLFPWMECFLFEMHVATSTK